MDSRNRSLACLTTSEIYPFQSSNHQMTVTQASVYVKAEATIFNNIICGDFLASEISTNYLK